MGKEDDRSIILIGMPAVGKSTVGVLLAKATGLNFVDTDVCIQAGENRGLQEIIDSDGLEAFLRTEERYLLRLDISLRVVATGGSVVYSDAAMRRLKGAGPAVYLRLGIDEIRRRIRNMPTRGVVIGPGQTLEGLDRQRGPLYEKWSDMTIDCDGKDTEQVVSEILTRLG